VYVLYQSRNCDSYEQESSICNTALNLKRLATETALPVASPSGNGGTAVGMVPIVVGKVTPVRYDSVEGSGQE
jgi:hypothetical protein